MQSLTFKIKLFFLGLFVAASAGLWIYQIYWARPAKECEAAQMWWYNPGRECVEPIPLYTVTGRPVAEVKKEEAAKQKAAAAAAKAAAPAKTEP